MAITVLPLTVVDIPAMGEIRERAYQDDSLIQAGRPQTLTPEEDQELKDWRSELSKGRMSAPNNHYFKAVDAQGRIVGYCGFHGPKPAGYQAPPRYNGRPKFLPDDNFEGVAARLAAAKKELFGGERDDLWYIQSMCVDPESQGQGIASQMLKHGLEELVDRDGGADCFTESTPVAVGTYRKAGFEPKLSVMGVVEGYNILLMVREKRNKD